MATKHETSNISLIQAVETLSSIADMDVGHEVGIEQEHAFMVQDKRITYKTVHWINRKNAGETIELVKDIFKVILTYLRTFYNKEYRSVKDEQTIEGIKTIMVLVGEAAKKLDKFTSLFDKHNRQSVVQLKEYKQLQDFYLGKIARKIDEGLLGQWLLALTKRSLISKSSIKLSAEKPVETKHIFVDLDAVKKDSEYELFFLRKEDGTRFYNPRLIRNIKLVCDFGDYFGKTKKNINPVEDIEIWRDHCYHSYALSILHSLGNYLNRFYREALRFRDKEIVELLNKALIALMLSANPHNQLRNIPLKSCADYFSDFQIYLKRVLDSVDYHKLITYPPKGSNQLGTLLLDLTHALCMGLFQYLQTYSDLLPHISNVIANAKESQSQEHEKAAKQSGFLWNQLSCDFAAMQKYFKSHSYGPLLKVLEILQSGEHLLFDPIHQGNLPNQQYFLLINDTKIWHTRLPSPTTQEFIHKASIVNEFKGLIRACFKDNIFRKILLINFQDRTSWREHSRCQALEELLNIEGFSKHLSLVTLPKDTEFYHQIAPYQQDNHADVFIRHLKDHLADTSTGFYFPEEIKKELFPSFIDGVIHSIHQVFFSGKNILLREHRLDFIEIFYLFLELKLVELIKPDAFSFICKDGIDIAPAASAQLYLFMKLLSNEPFSEADKNQLRMTLYSPAIMLRERILLPERFNRMISTVKAIESVQDQAGRENFHQIISDAFGEYYRSPILHSQVMNPSR
jgi:hypothetical protein